MYRFVLLFGVIVVAVHSQCPPPSRCSGSGTFSGSESGTGCESDNTCKQVTSNFTSKVFKKMMTDQPTYVRFYANRYDVTDIDNECMTLFPLAGNPQMATFYDSVVFSNGTNLIQALTVFHNCTDSTLVFSNPSYTFTMYGLGPVGCGTYANYQCGNYGDNPAPFVIGMGPGGNGTGKPGKLSVSCQKKAQSVIAKAGLSPSTLSYVLPYKLPTACVVKQLCMPENSSLYCEQGGGCQPYEK